MELVVRAGRTVGSGWMLIMAAHVSGYPPTVPCHGGSSRARAPPFAKSDEVHRRVLIQPLDLQYLHV